jgi:hypothetical protein
MCARPDFERDSVVIGRGSNVTDKGSDMTNDRRPNDTGATPSCAWLALVLAGALLQACAPNAGPAGSRLRVFAADVTGAAKTCEPSTISPAAGQATEATIKLVNDGGWCGLPAHQAGPKPYEAGLLTVRPGHGNVLIHEVGDETRIDYTPDHGFSGTDIFSVKLIPGDATVNVAVTVTAPAT